MQRLCLVINLDGTRQCIWCHGLRRICTPCDVKPTEDHLDLPVVPLSETSLALLATIPPGAEPSQPLEPGSSGPAEDDIGLAHKSEVAVLSEQMAVYRLRHDAFAARKQRKEIRLLQQRQLTDQYDVIVKQLAGAEGAIKELGKKIAFAAHYTELEDAVEFFRDRKWYKAQFDGITKELSSLTG